MAAQLVVSIRVPEAAPEPGSCPQCGGPITGHLADYGIDPDTGYHDAGYRFTCLDPHCGYEGTEDELPCQ